MAWDDGSKGMGKGPVGGSAMAPKDTLVLIPGASEWAALQGKRDFADVGEVKDPEAERPFWVTLGLM